KDAQTSFDYQTSATQVLYLQHVIRNLRNGGRCGIVLDEGLLFRTNEDAFVKTKRKLLDDCNVWCIVSLPAGVFTAAGAGVKTNLVFFSKGKPTENIWYYDLTDVKVRKKTPLTIKHFVDFFKHLPQRAETELSWTVNVIDRKRKAAEEAKPFKETANQKQQQALPVAERIKTLKNLIAKTKRQITANEKDLKSQSDKTEFKELDLKLTQLLANVTDQLNETENNYKSIMAEFREASAKAKEIEDAVYDLKAVNPNKKQTIDTRTPNELIDIIEAKGKEIAEALAELRKISA
ncbi:N-6 DNA methylase, partial [candidate division KSB1 bacterium]|nr:N-6 DNA methylase [candidate division KSB1 bacterium]